MIRDEDISIVVQGPILYKAAFGITEETTKLVCKRVKEIFPKAELVLSTWEGSDVTSIPYNKLVLSKDPGATRFVYKDYKLLNNCNRLIVSTKAGVEAASGKYVLKLRSDLFTVSKSFLKYFYQFPYYEESQRFVKNRIIAFSLETIKSHKTCLFTMKRPYHISDWAYFGYKEDLLNLYSIPLTDEPKFSQWFLKRYRPFFDIETDRLWKMPPEQYVTVSFLQKYTPIEFQHTTDLSNNNVRRSEILLANNFLVLDQTQFQLISLKYVKFQLLFPPLLSDTAYFFATWLQDYHKYCNVPNSLQKVRPMLQIFSRTCTYWILNRFLRILGLTEGQNPLLKRLAAYFIKKYDQ